MGRQQFENQFKDKLEKREIRPSAGSWEQLAGKLDSAEKKPISFFWWVGIAATIVGGVLVYSLVFNFNSNIGSPVIVDAPSEEILQDKDPVQENTPIASEETRQKENSEVATTEKEAKPSEDNLTPAKSINPGTNKSAGAQIASAQPQNDLKEEENISATAETAEEIHVNSKLKELLAEISVKENANGTDAEIDALLYKAAREISLEQNPESLSGTIDAEDLLFDVEMELEQSFREKVFDLLKEGYTKARTAVANRNY